MKNYLQRLLLKIVVNASQFIAKFNMPFINKRMSSRDYRDIQSQLQSGFIMLSSIHGELSNVFIPGDYGHAVIVKDKFTVIEATTKGVVETDLIDFVMTKDSIVLLKPLFATSEERAFATAIAMEQIGKPYDYGMVFSESNIKAFYCSELVYYAFMQACKKSPFVLKETLGLQTVTPTDFLLATDKFQVIWRK